MAADATSSVARRTLTQDDVQGVGVVQGGVVAGMIGDVVARLASDAAGCAEIETLDVTFERPATPGEVTIVATLRRHGRTVMAWDAKLLDATGRTVASAQTTLRVSPR